MGFAGKAILAAPIVLQMPVKSTAIILQNGLLYSFHNIPYPTPGEKKVLVYLCIAFIVSVSAYAIYITYLYRNKGRINQRKMKARAEKDAAWDHDQIIAHSKKIYMELQKAMTAMDLLPVKSRVSDTFYRWHLSVIYRYKRAGMRHVIKNVSISEASIVYFEDYKNDFKDTVAVLISGTSSDYYITSDLRRHRQSAAFKEILIFTRNEKGWILDEIVNNPDFYQVTKPNNFIER